MSRLAPAAAPAEQLRLTRALGLVPLRLRARRTASHSGDRPQPTVVLAAGLSLQRLGEDRLWLALLAAAGIPPEGLRAQPASTDPALLSVGLPDSEARIPLPEPRQLRGNAAAKRALWPQLRRLRRELLPQ